MPNMPTARCDSCVYYDQMNQGPTGICRLNPPTVIPTQIGEHHQVGDMSKGVRTTKPFTTWPIVRKDDWCGCYATELVRSQV